MMKYNESLQKAGCCSRSTACTRRRWARGSRFPAAKPKVTDGPFTEAKEVIGGYWMIQVKSKEEAIEWASRCPGIGDEVIEVRQVQELSDFPADVQKAAAGFPKLQAQVGQRHTRVSHVATAPLAATGAKMV